MFLFLLCIAACKLDANVIGIPGVFRLHRKRRGNRDIACTGTVPRLFAVNCLHMIPWLGKSLTFPPLTKALQEPNGLLAAGGDLAPERLLSAYRRGIFPWYSPGQPILWWSPDPRMVLFPDEFEPRRSLAKVLRNREYEIRCDSDFEQVMRN